MLTQPDLEMYLIAIVFFAPSQWQHWNFLKPEDFSDSLAARVWSEIGKFIDENRRPEPRTIAMAICQNEEDQKATANLLLDWAANLISPAMGDDYARTIKDLSDRRKIAHTAKEIVAMAENPGCGYNASEIADMGISRIHAGIEDKNDFVPFYDIGLKVIASLKEIKPCYSTGFTRLDNIIGGGLYRNRFYGIGGRMKGGKSLLMSSIAYNMATSKTARILCLSLEMSSEESVQRILSMRMGINSLQFLKSSVRASERFQEKITRTTEDFKDCGLYLRTRPRMTLDDLKSTIARAGMSGMVDGIIVDYLQLVEGKEKGQSSSEHYDNVAQTLAEAVKRYPIWILTAAQLNRDGNIRGSDGLLMACDIAFAIHKIDGDTANSIADKAWLQMLVSRYTPNADIGSKDMPGYEIDTFNGPMFREM